MLKKIVLLCLLVNPLFGEKIVDLLPSFSDPLLVDPALPSNYVMDSFCSPPDLYGGVVWGAEDDVEMLIDHPQRIRSTYIFVRLSGDIVQIDPMKFDDEEQLPSKLAEMGSKEIQIRKTLWGRYPVLIAEYLDEFERENYLAWVGLNSVRGGWVLVFSFHYPDNQAGPTSDQLSIWKTFLADTHDIPRPK